MALRISYLNDVISKIPHGKFLFSSGKKIIIINYDPEDPHITATNRKRYLADSFRGRKYIDPVSLYLQYKSELDYLMAKWDSLYWAPPVTIPFPLVKTRSSMLTSDFFASAGINQNTFRVENPIIHKGMILRSKNELIACQVLDRMGIEYKIEPEIIIDGFTVFTPDILFNLPELDKCTAIELDGAMNKEAYRNKSESRMMNYFRNGFKEYKDIIFMRMYDPSEFEISTFESMIRTSVESNICDIVFPDD